MLLAIAGWGGVGVSSINILYTNLNDMTTFQV